VGKKKEKKEKTTSFHFVLKKKILNLNISTNNRFFFVLREQTTFSPLNK